MDIELKKMSKLYCTDSLYLCKSVNFSLLSIYLFLFLSLTLHLNSQILVDIFQHFYQKSLQHVYFSFFTHF